MSDIKLTDYLPDSGSIDSATLKEVRSRISAYLENEFSGSVDTSPNSVFGDLVLTPLTYMIASFEIAASRIFSDIDLANVAAGTVYNCDFVHKYLENFGLSQRNSTKTTGVVQITFSESNTYEIDASAAISFNTPDGEYFLELSDVADALIIKPGLEAGEETPSLRQLIKVNDTEYVVNLPIEGVAGITITKNQTAKSNIAISQISSIKAISDFDPGTLPENVMELADKSRNTYYAASLASRNGTLSFLLQTYPELQGISPVVSGDREMIRGGYNMFGIQHGVMDIFIKSKKNLLTTSVTQKLAYNENTNCFLGLLEKPQGPPITIDSIHASGGTDSIEYDVFSKASDKKLYPGLSHAYSKNEYLSIYAETTPTNVETVDPELTYTTNIPSELGALSITGQCQGSLFKTASQRSITVSFNAYDTVNYETVTITIADNTETLVLVMQRDPADLESDGTVLYNATFTKEHNRFLNGINISFSLNTANETALKQLTTLIDADYKEVFTVTPKTANFTANYSYDPLILNIDSLTVGNDVKPINCDIQVRSFIPCLVSNLTIVYRSKSGSIVDLEAAKTDIVNYVNGLSYPNLYETFTVAELLLYHGADGVKSVTQQGKFYPCVAPYIINDESTFNINQFSTWGPDKINEEFNYKCDPIHTDATGTIPYHTVPTTTLLPSNEITGMGDRNIQYILATEDIVFDEVSF